MRIVALSDTHGRHRKIRVPDGDVLVHCGDVACDLEDFGDWLGSMPHPHILMTWGNHDRFAERNQHEAAMIVQRAAGCAVHVLVNEAVSIDGLVFHGSPYSNPFGRWAFMPTEKEQAAHYETLRGDVVFSHGPPWGAGDRLVDGRRVGSKALLERLWYVRPRLVLCGHIHEDHGRRVIDWSDRGPSTPVYNVSVLDEKYRVAHGATVIDLDTETVTAPDGV